MTADAHVGRQLHWPDCLNVRDLGGLPTAGGGGSIRRGALVRSDLLSRLTDDGIAAVRAYGIRRVIDLRTSVEITRTPGPFAGDPIYLSASFIDEQAERDRDRTAEGTTLADWYRGSVERNASKIVAGLIALATAPAGGVLVHCYSGKDRTGVHVALALAVAGVGFDQIAADYALSAGFLRPHLKAASADGKTVDLVDELGSEPETIIGTLEHVQRRYDGVEEYLIGHGMTRQQLVALRDRLLAA